MKDDRKDPKDNNKNPKEEKTKESKRQKRIDHKLPLAEYIRRHSPVKRGIETNEDLDKTLARYNKIMSRIYVGNYEAAEDKNFIQEKNIKAILNCTKDFENKFCNNRDIEYMRIPVNDNLRESDFKLMYKFFPVITEFIHKHADIQGNNILVHCAAGRQRSISAVVAYIMRFHGLNPHEACKLVLEKRPEAFHHGLSLNFDQALKWYYRDLQKDKSKK